MTYSFLLNWEIWKIYDDSLGISFRLLNAESDNGVCEKPANRVVISCGFVHTNTLIYGQIVWISRQSNELRQIMLIFFLFHFSFCILHLQVLSLDIRTSTSPNFAEEKSFVTLRRQKTNRFSGGTSLFSCGYLKYFLLLCMISGSILLHSNDYWLPRTVKIVYW